MNLIKILAACLVLSGCVSADCISDCYLTEQEQYDSKFDSLCQKHTFDRRCEGRSPLRQTP